MMELFLYRTILLIIDSVLFGFLVRGVGNKKYGKKYDGFLLLFIVLISVLESVFFRYQNQSLISWFNLISLMLLLFAVGNRFYLSLKDLCIWLFLFVSMSMVCEGSSLVFLEKIIKLEHKQILSSYLIFGTLVTYVLKGFFIFIIERLFKRRQLDGKKIPRNMLIPLLAMPVLSIVFFTVILLIDVKTNSVLSLERNLLILGTILINGCLLYFMNKLSIFYKKYTETQISNQLFETELKSIKCINHNLEEMKILKHDMKNKLLIIDAYLNEEEYEKSSAYINSLIKKIDSTELQFYTPNYLLNYYLNKKIKHAESLEVTFITNILVPEKTRIDADILSALLGNLIDNAVNACTRIQNKHTKKEIRLLIKEKPNKILLEIVNTFDAKERKLKEKIFGTGIGLLSSKKIIEEHDGIYKQWSEGNKYYVSVILFQ